MTNATQTTNEALTETLIKLAEIEKFLKAASDLQTVATVGTILNDLTDVARNQWKAVKAAPAPAPAPVVETVEAPATANEVADGTYTVALKDGSHVTIKFENIETGKLAGKRIVSFLIGSDNETNFKGFGFVNNGTVKVWNKYSAEFAAKYGEAANMVLGYPIMAPEFQEAYAMKSGRCARCNRKLTVPASINRGLGPECAKKS